MQPISEFTVTRERDVETGKVDGCARHRRALGCPWAPVPRAPRGLPLERPRPERAEHFGRPLEDERGASLAVLDGARARVAPSVDSPFTLTLRGDRTSVPGRAVHAVPPRFVENRPQASPPARRLSLRPLDGTRNRRASGDGQRAPGKPAVEIGAKRQRRQPRMSKSCQQVAWSAMVGR
jgi:hypothetical protein